MKKILFIALGALLATSSCTSEVNDEGFIDKANAISFNAYPNKSRALGSDVTSDNMKGDNFGVVGYTNNDKKIYLYTGSYAAVNQTWDGDSWEYANMGDLKFWPNNAMDFYAYFPYTDNATFAASNTSGNVMTIPTTCAHDVLFAFAGDQSKQTLVQTRVPLTFNHAFAKMKSLQIEMPAEGMLNKSGCQIEVKGVEFINTSTSGNIKVDNAGVASYEVATPNVTLSEDLSSVVTVNNANTSGALINNGTNAKGYFFATNSTKVNDVVGTRKAMWNGTKDALNSSKLSKKSFVCLKLTCKVWNGADNNKYYYVGDNSSYGVIYIPLTGSSSDPNSVTTFDAGKRYTYTIKMKDNVGFTDEGDPILTPILFEVQSVVGWEDVNVTITL
ncbi:MAG: fimbrillin family protein [Bacteroidales bacterium]|nr:fimbrillin family protein [Bacteroidales bacterium]